jgi:hypothetical protein
MKYNEADLTEATKIISYLRSIRIYAVAMVCLCLLYLVFKIYYDTRGTELYLLSCSEGIITVDSLSILILIATMCISLNFKRIQIS